ncbi:hypothetical protein ACFWDQ_08650 [Streptomyces sp. NPDC060053]|uniref:hypothetical protein n=1 Tax=Streptomyces sp. NPDC060053 TaxID=3347047 RepID=UPI003685B2C6
MVPIIADGSFGVEWFSPDGEDYGLDDRHQHGTDGTHGTARYARHRRQWRAVAARMNR